MQITKEQFEELKQEYRRAEEKGKDMFIFMNEEFLTSYAKYLIEYMETQMIKTDHETIRTF